MKTSLQFFSTVLLLFITKVPILAGVVVPQPIIPVNGVYTVTSAAQLFWVAQMVNDIHTGGYTFDGETILLGADIDLAGYAWTPIGTSHIEWDKTKDIYDNEIPYRDKPFSFCGTFDGQGHVIRNMTINISNIYKDRTIGLFGTVKKGNHTASIRNIGIIDAKITYTAQSYESLGVWYYPYYCSIGFLAGFCTSVPVSSCYVENSTLTVDNGERTVHVGGLVGRNDLAPLYALSIRNSGISVFSKSQINPGGYYTCENSPVGGIVGTHGSVITYPDLAYCYSKATIQSNVSTIGGIAGYASSAVFACRVEGDIEFTGNSSGYAVPKGQADLHQYEIGGILGTGGNISECVMTGNINCSVEKYPNTRYNVDEVENTYDSIPSRVCIGGIAGYVDRQFASNCIFSGNINYQLPQAKNNLIEFHNGGIFGYLVATGGIYNNIYTGNNLGTIKDRSNQGVLSGFIEYSTEMTDLSAYQNNYYVTDKYPLFGGRSETIIGEPDCHKVNISQLLTKDFYMDATRWDVNKLGVYNRGFWSPDCFYFPEGQLPQTKRLVSSYNSNVWDGVSLLIPSSIEGKVTINNPAQLAWLATEVNMGNSFAEKAIELSVDLDMGNYPFTPIGNTMTGNEFSFRGIFDGQGYTIKNYYVYQYILQEAGGERSFGIFGHVSGNAVLKNLKLNNCRLDIKGMAPYSSSSPNAVYAGSLAAYVRDTFAIVSNCHATNVTITADSAYHNGRMNNGGLIGVFEGSLVEDCSAQATMDIRINKEEGYKSSSGGLIGGADGGHLTPNNSVIIRNCSASPSIKSVGEVGGLIGHAQYGVKIENCFASGGKGVEGSSNGYGAGGLIGHLDAQTSVSRSFSTVPVNGRGRLGGLLGQTTTNGDIRECYASGDVTITGHNPGGGSYDYAGGLIGYITTSEPTIINCYATGNITSEETSAFDHNRLGGLTGDRLSFALNCYASGKINVEKSGVKDNYVNGLCGFYMQTGYNNFSTCEISSKPTGNVITKGIADYIVDNDNVKTSYHTLQGKTVGTYSNPDNFKTAVFFTNPGNWTEAVLSKDDKTYQTGVWDPQVWSLADNRYPLLRLFTINVEPSVSSATISWSKEAGADSYILKVYSDNKLTELLFEQRYDAQGNIMLRSTGEDKLSAVISDLIENTQYYYALTSYTSGNEVIAEVPGFFVTTGATGLKETEKEKISVYPNPATDYIFVQGVQCKPNEVKLFDLTGQSVSVTVLEDNGGIKINISPLSNGIYFLSVSGKSEKILKK